MIKAHQGGKYRAISGNYFPLHPQKYKGPEKSVQYKSSLEKEMMYKCDTWSQILEWNYENIRIPYIDKNDGKTKHYYIDFDILVQTNHGIQRFLVEVKDSRELVEPKKPKRITESYKKSLETYFKNKSKWEVAEKYAKYLNAEWRIITEKELK